MARRARPSATASESRLLLCNDDASCKFSCDSTSACGDPAPGKEKGLQHRVYLQRQAGRARRKILPPTPKAPQELSCE